MHANLIRSDRAYCRRVCCQALAANLSTYAINGVAGWNHAFNANVLNEARFGFLTVAGGQTSPNAGNSGRLADGNAFADFLLGCPSTRKLALAE
jgi:hypothetical protein